MGARELKQIERQLILYDIFQRNDEDTRLSTIMYHLPGMNLRMLQRDIRDLTDAGLLLVYFFRDMDAYINCGEHREEEGLCHIKARYGNRKFFTTGFKTKDVDSIMLIRWKNDANGHSYEMRKPEMCKDGDLLRMDLTKEFAAMGLESKEKDEKAKRGGGSSNFRAYGEWIHVGE